MQSNYLQTIQRAAAVPTALCLLLHLSVPAAFGGQVLPFGNFHRAKDAEKRCDEFADPIPLIDPSTRGPGIDLSKMNVSQALPACQQAAELSQNPRYVGLYSVVLRFEGNFAEAIRQAEWAAARGNALAMMNLGEWYANGQGVSRNSAESAAWYRKAADTGNAFAMEKLADHYVTGDGVPQDGSVAASLYQKSADQGIPPAMTGL